MARRKEQDTVNVNGLSAQDILNLDFDTLNTLNDKNMRLMANRLVSVANKRIRRLEKYIGGDNAITDYNPALESINHKQFSIRGKNRNQVYQTLANIQSFLNYKTSTMGGFKDYIKNVSNVIESNFGFKFGSQESKDVFSLLDKVRSQFYGEIYASGVGSDTLIGMIKEYKDDGLTDKEIFTRIERFLTGKYEDKKITELEDIDEEEVEDVLFGYNDL